MWHRELVDAFPHEHLFHFGKVHMAVDIGELFVRGQSVDLSSKDGRTVLNRLIRGGRIRLDITASKRIDIPPRNIVGILCPRAGKDDLLGEFCVFVTPELLILAPNTFGIYSATNPCATAESSLT